MLLCISFQQNAFVYLLSKKCFCVSVSPLWLFVLNFTGFTTSSIPCYKAGDFGGTLRDTITMSMCEKHNGHCTMQPSHQHQTKMMHTSWLMRGSLVHSIWNNLHMKLGRTNVSYITAKSTRVLICAKIFASQILWEGQTIKAACSWKQNHPKMAGQRTPP